MLRMDGLYVTSQQKVINPPIIIINLDVIDILCLVLCLFQVGTKYILV